MSPTQVGQGGINTRVQFSNQGGLSNQGYILPPVYQYPQQFMVNPGSPVLNNQYQNTPGVINNDILVTIQTSLESMHKKLGQLDTIQSSVQNITIKLVEMERQMRDMEDSQNFISGKYDILSTHTETNTNTIATLTSELKTLKTTNTKLKEDIALFRDDIIDLKCRSMRDNLLFMGIPEGATTHLNGTAPIPEPIQPQQLAADTTPEGSDSTDPVPADTTPEGSDSTDPVPADTTPVGSDSTDPVPAGVTTNTPQSNQSAERSAFTQDDCVKKVHFFCEIVLQVENASVHVRIDRAHRIGAFSRGKTRPTVVKFADTASKLLVKSALKSVNLRQTTYPVVEQFAQEVKERRKELIPKLIEARQRGDKAVLVRDKLFINNIQYRPTSGANPSD